MATSNWKAALAAGLVIGTLGFFLEGCSGNDLGSACDMNRPVCVANCDDPDPANWEIENQLFTPPPGTTLDYISTGPGCDDFTCVDTAGDGDQNAYCSRRCIEDAQCSGGEDGLVCRTLNLDDTFINTLRDDFALRCENECDVECPDGCTEACIDQCADRRFRQIFGDIVTARYCARPE